MSHLGYSGHDNDSSINDFKKKYVRAEVSPSNGDGSETWMCLKRKEGACIFLDPVGKCGIYDVRPVQCSTYPFWPSLLNRKEEWEEEAVFPDDVVLRDGMNDRHWSPELGGCEGIKMEISDDYENRLNGNIMDIINDDVQIDNEDVKPTPIVERQEIVSKMKAAKKHWKRFPVQEIKESTWYL